MSRGGSPEEVGGRLAIFARARIVLAGLVLFALLAVGVDAYALGHAGPRGEAAAPTVGLTARQVIRAWFAAWNANDARRLCSLYGRALLASFGGDVEHRARVYGQLQPQRFQIASFESDGRVVTVGVVAGHHGGAVYLAREHGIYKIVGFLG